MNLRNSSGARVATQLNSSSSKSKIRSIQHGADSSRLAFWDMPQSYKIDRQHRIVISRAWGVCTANDVLEFREQVLRDEDFDPDFCQLVDFSHVTGLEITANEVRMLAEMSPFSSDSRRALVAGTPLVFGFARMFETVRELRGEKHLRVFHNREDALAWLMAKEEAA